MARVVGAPPHGESRASVRTTLFAAFGLPTVALAVVGFMAWSEGSSEGVLAVLGVWSLIALMGWRWIRLDLKKAKRSLGSYSSGARAEAATVRELESLPADFVVFHGFRFADVDRLTQGWSLDHVVVGPSGVFAVAVGEASLRRDGLDAPRADYEGRFARNVADLRDLLRAQVPSLAGRVEVVAVLVETAGTGHERRAASGMTVSPEGLREALAGSHESRGRPIDPEEVSVLARAVLGQYPEAARAVFGPGL